MLKPLPQKRYFVNFSSSQHTAVFMKSGGIKAEMCLKNTQIFKKRVETDRQEKLCRK